MQKSPYGLKQANKNWNTLLHAYLTENGYEQKPAHNCLYTREKQNGKVILIIWVDNLIIDVELCSLRDLQ